MRFVATLLTVFALATTLSCSKSSSPTGPDPGGAATEVEAGNAALASGNYAEANAQFKNAIAKDPSNTSAQIGVAVTELYLVQNDSEVAELLGFLPEVPLGSSKSPHGALAIPRNGGLFTPLTGSNRDFGPFSEGRAIGTIIGRAVTDPPAISDIQRVIRLKVMPKLQYIEERLNIIEAQPGFVLRLPPAVTDLSDTLEIDLGDVMLLDSALNGVQGWLGLLVAYNFDLPSYEHVNAESLLAEGTDWATLHADGVAQLGASRGNFLHAKELIDAAAASIAAETDDQSDDLVPAEAIASDGFAELVAALDKLEDSLNGAVLIQVEDGVGNPFELSVHLGRFFTHPIDDLKTILPAHDFDEEGEPVLDQPLDFPDPTINAIFPEMTDELWNQLAGPPATIAAR